MTIETKQYLTVPFEFKNSEMNDDKFYYFEGYACTYGNIDSGGDIIQKGAVELVEKPKFCYQHNMKDPIGTYLEMYSDERGLFIKARMRKGFEKTDWIASLIEDGAIDSMSIGYFAKEYTIDPKTSVRTLTKIKIFETSFVTMPMNPEAELTNFKEATTEENNETIELEVSSLKDIETILREKGFSRKEAKTLISKTKEFSNQCDAEEKEVKQCDAELKAKLLADIKSITNQIKKI